jgi:hypothetical protein
MHINVNTGTHRWAIWSENGQKYDIFDKTYPKHIALDLLLTQKVVKMISFDFAGYYSGRHFGSKGPQKLYQPTTLLVCHYEPYFYPKINLIPTNRRSKWMFMVMLVFCNFLTVWLIKSGFFYVSFLCLRMQSDTNRIPGSAKWSVKWHKKGQKWYKINDTEMIQICTTCQFGPHRRNRPNWEYSFQQGLDTKWPSESTISMWIPSRKCPIFVKF